ncbi:alpha/beta hydrolase [Isosphaeraceae bacterium EP7]
MRSGSKAALAAFALMGFVGVRACAADDPSIVRNKDVVYASPSGTPLKLDVARPLGEGPFPAVLAIHGGGWRGGSKGDVAPLMDQLVHRGYVAVSPQYRFCPEFPFPAQVHDVKAAVRWVKAHAAEYRIDPERVGVVGFSAGGHLALMLGLTDAKDGLEGDAEAGSPSTRVRAIVNYFGPTDLTARDLPIVSGVMVHDFLGGLPVKKPELAAQASPLTFLTRDDPPILTFQGTKDELVPATQATKLREAMTKLGVGGRVDILEGAGHGWAGAEMERTLAETYAFFDEHLKPKPAPKPAP